MLVKKKGPQAHLAGFFSSYFQEEDAEDLYESVETLRLNRYVIFRGIWKL